MPCSDDGRGYSELQDRCNKVTHLLCDACRFIERNHDFGNKVSAELFDWYQEHKKVDAERAREQQQADLRQQYRATAISKLSREERQALGITT